MEGQIPDRRDAFVFIDRVATRVTIILGYLSRQLA
jgi:hypothetical protein